MMDREKRRNIIRKIVRFWYNHNLAIAVSLTLAFLATTITVLCVCLNTGNNSDVNQTESETGDYSAIFGDVNDGASNTKRKIRNSSSDTVSSTGEEIEYTTVLQYNSNTKNGYMNNCIFLGDSRTVAMVSYGFVSDENVLAKVGISHPSVLSATFTQNSGKEYTVKKYLETHKAQVIYLAFGVNGMGGSDEKYEKSFKEMVEAIMDMAPDSEIVIMAIGPVDDNGPYKKTCQNSWIDKYNNFLESLAEYEGIYYLDVDSVLKGEDGQVKPEYDAGDGLHYKACAYTVMLEYIIHHPVPGISDEGEFVVKYVKPTGQFKKMMKDTATLPANAVVVSEEEAKQEEVNNEEPQVTIEVTPSPVVIQKQPEEIVYPTLSPSPTIPPIVNVEPTVVPDDVLPGNTPTPPPVLEEPTTPVEEPTPEVVPETEPIPEPGEEPTPEPAPDSNNGSEDEPQSLDN